MPCGRTSGSSFPRAGSSSSREAPSAGRIKQEDVEAVRERTDIVKLVSQYLTLKKAGARLHDRPLPVPPGEDAVVQRLPRQAGLLLPRLRRGRRRHPVHPRAGAPQLHRGGRAPGAAGGRGAPVRGRLAGGAPRAAAPQDRAAPGERGGRAAVRARCSRTARRRPTRASTSRERGISAESLETVRHRVRADVSGLPAPAAERASSRPRSCWRRGWPRAATTGSVRDRFRGRITFPIHDLQGRGIGFGARILPTDARASEQAKYLNTAETPIYKKHEVLLQPAGARRPRSRAAARSSWSRGTPT